MSVDLFDQVYCFVQRNKKMVIGLLAAIIALAVYGLRSVQYHNNVEAMLPMDQNVQRSMRFLRESNFSNKLVISLGLKNAQQTSDDLALAADRFIASLGPPFIQSVIGNLSSGSVIDEMNLFLRYTPQLLNPETLSRLKDMATSEGIQQRLRFIYRQSLAPNSAFMLPFLRADPFGISIEIMRAMEKLPRASEYDVVMDNGRLMSKDGKHALVIVETPVTLTDGFGSRRLIAYLAEKIRQLPAYVSADIIAGHLHTISNEDVIKKDIRLISTIASISFLLLFFFVFRDIRAVAIFLIPMAAVVIATNITYGVFKNLSYSVVGMGTVIAGIAIDYGIYVYMAVRKAGNSMQTIKQVVSPIVSGVLTTISVFAAFFFSSVQGYQQLAFFSNVSVIICLILSLFVLPFFLAFRNDAVPDQNTIKRSPDRFRIHDRLLEPPRVLWNFGEIPRTLSRKIFDFLGVKPVEPCCTPVRGDVPLHHSSTGEARGIRAKGVIIVWAVILVSMLAIGSRIRFHNDITELDGTSTQILKAEERFHDIWGGKNLPAILVATAKDLETAYQLNDDVYQAALKSVGTDTFISFATVWPGRQTRAANLSRWEAFWTKDKEDEVRRMFSEYGQAYHLAPDAFQPFFEGLHPRVGAETEPKGLAFFDQLKQQFVIRKDGGYQMLSYFPDEEKLLSVLVPLANDYPGTFIVSRKTFSQQIARALTKEFIFLSLLALGATMLITFFLLRHILLTLLAMVPIATSLVMIVGVLSVSGRSFNIPSIMAAMIVVGLVSDYGLFVVYYCKNRFQTGTYEAVTLAAVTTLIGAGVLLFTRHPVLFSVGVTLVTGVLSGYLSSLLVIPPLYRLWMRKESTAC